LRERPDDLRVLASDLLARAAARHQRPITGYTPQALACLSRYDWPGNVRQLENAIDEACLVATGSEVQMEDLPDTVRLAAVSPSLPFGDPSRDRRRLPDIEQMYIDAALERHFGNRRRAAEDLGISLPTLYAKLSRHRRSRRTGDPAV
jgi:DNA-binding NtrC family response regulator